MDHGWPGAPVKKREELAIGVIALIALIIVPYQFYLGGKLLHLKEEAANITAYLFEERIENGAYPQDLSGYTFTFPQLKNHFRYQPGSNDQFDLDYYVGTPNTSHYYSSELQKWEYYPD